MAGIDMIKRFQPRPKSRVGLDIGSYSIKIIEVLPAEKPTLVSFGSKKVHGLPREAVSASIRSLVEELKITAKDFNVSLSGSQLIARLISMPKMSHDELKGAMRFETEKLIPFDINECILDFQVFGQPSKDKATVDVLLAAAKREHILQKIRLVQDAGFGVRVVDVDSFAIANAFQAGVSALDQAKTYAVINMGAAITNLGILRGSVPAVVRDIAIGGNDMTAAIARRLGIGQQAAEDLKVAPKDKAAEAIEAVRPVLTAILDEVKLSFGYHENQTGRGIDEIYVSGGSADTAGLADVFEDALGSKPRRWDPFSFLNMPDIDSAALGSLKSVFGVAVGLAMR